MAGTGQSRGQVGRRKPVIQSGTAGKILSGSPGTALGRVLPANALARATAFPRTAGIQYPVAVGSVRLGSERSPRPAIADARRGWIDARGAFPLMMQFQRSTTGKLSDPLPFHSLARRGATKRDAPVRPLAWERGNLPSARPIRRSPGNPHGCWTSHSRFTVNSKIDMTVNFRRKLSATFLPSDLPSD
jgi:hypothetical protein